MKKIGIITFHIAHNYGAVLQTYALQKVLSKENEVKIIDYKNKEMEKNYSILRINKKNILTVIKSILSTIIFYNKLSKRYIKFKEFIKQEINLTRSYDSEKDLKNCPPKLDVYITGSDQVWNYHISERKVDAYTLNFGNDNVKKISYAASIGTNEFDEENKQKYIKNIQKLNYISVREESAKEYLKNIIDTDIKVTLDPTLLMTKQEWEQCFELENKEKEKYIFAYTLTDDNEYYRIINHLSEITGLKIIHVDKRNKGIKNILRNAYADGPIEFLRLIKNAEYVVTSSFHATVFSLIFNKKIWTIPPKKTGSRIINLLEKVGISNRIVYNLEEFENRKYDEQINYAEINEKLENEREKSILWLKNAISEE